ncbi:nucleoside triphosphate pyrophosphohydrolase family protein [Rhizobium leguminosarum]|uniref:nucleoside triphosphate pyrophosphohydrolase family protein n=1 Tax=Rhizobium TaxID=379 RepID=UPI0013DD7F7F|nr:MULTISPECIES: nucleoside triphosphate pyrophosphohydrolase family protein [Rhizobium]MCA2434876.1 nucleoside triphosphate pyrophosphohydrolase family protein [Rhizobium leguminosarum]NEH82943.1 pyrophosphatase [Rhizobium ruizarguesonis]
MHHSLGLNEYQALAARTDKTRAKGNGFDLPVLGLVGEVGSLLSELKKKQRDSAAYVSYENTVLEELGDALWYLAIIADHATIKLAVIASEMTTDGTEVYFAALQPQHALPLNSPTVKFEKTLLKLAGATGALSSFIVEGDPPDPSLLRVELTRTFKLLVEAANEAAVTLEAAARQNLAKAEDRWPSERVFPTLFDADFDPHEQLPRKLEIEIYERDAGGGKSFVLQRCNGIFIGDRLTDNIMRPDDYRFHDVFHYAYAAILGWSPVIRALFKVKRKSQAQVDEGQDGARAGLIEEGVATYVFGIAKEFDFFHNEKPGDLSFTFLKNVRQFVRGYEVDHAPLWLWEEAILQGNHAFRFLRENRRGLVKLDIEGRSLTIEELPK